MAVTLEDLKALVLVVEGKVAALPPVDPARYESYAEHRQAAEAVLNKLVRDHGGNWGSQLGGVGLSLAGIRCTCTAGPAGVIRNWLTAAGKRIALLEAAA